MSCVSQKERAVVEGQVPVGFLVMEGWVQVDRSSPCLFVRSVLVLPERWDNLWFLPGRLSCGHLALPMGDARHGGESSTETPERGGVPRPCQSK